MTKSLEEEAKKFAKQKRKPSTVKELSPRLYLAGQAMGGFIAAGRQRLDLEKGQKIKWQPGLDFVFNE